VTDKNYLATLLSYYAAVLIGCTTGLASLSVRPFVRLSDTYLENQTVQKTKIDLNPLYGTSIRRVKYYQLKSQRLESRPYNMSALFQHSFLVLTTLSVCLSIYFFIFFQTFVKVLLCSFQHFNKLLSKENQASQQRTRVAQSTKTCSVS